jgi:hypothetical protein
LKKLVFCGGGGGGGGGGVWVEVENNYYKKSLSFLEILKFMSTGKSQLGIEKIGFLCVWGGGGGGGGGGVGGWVEVENNYYKKSLSFPEILKFMSTGKSQLGIEKIGFLCFFWGGGGGGGGGVGLRLKIIIIKNLFPFPRY